MHRIAPIISLAALLMAVAPLCFSVGCREKPPQLGSANPLSIEVVIAGEHVASITNPATVLSVLRGGRAVRAHDCTIAGEMLFQYPDGVTKKVYFLPGHRPSEYEFSADGAYYAVPRSDFIKAMGSSGVDTNKFALK